MLSEGLCSVVGFEPHKAAFDALVELAGPNELYLPHAVGDGAVRKLHVTASMGMTSLLEPDPVRLAMFAGFTEWGAVIREDWMETYRLDGFTEIKAMDLLKIDVQGSELLVFGGAKLLLAGAVAVHTEVSFVPLYKNQPSFGDIDSDLRAKGYLPHCFESVKRWPLGPVKVSNQLLEADIVYFKDLARADEYSVEQLKHLALLAHYVYRSYDVAHAVLVLLVGRDDLDAAVPDDYIESCMSTRIVV
jgi:FkbM family methyltransferase